MRPFYARPSPKKGERDRKKLKTALALLPPNLEKGLGDKGRFSICVR